MEAFYHSLSKAINIDEEREKYTKLYDFVRNSILIGLKENEVFKSLFADLSLCGSYADNLKVSKPDEFDLVLRLAFPFPDDVVIEEDLSHSGNVYINLYSVICEISKLNPPKENMLKFLRGITNADGYVLQDKFQSWFEGALTRFLSKIEYKLIYEKENVFLRYIKQGPAHTIKVNSSCGQISIDLVPGFRFSKSQSISPMNHLIEECDTWEAIPKPINGRHSNPSFQCSYTESERRLLSGRNQFKNTLRMMKKFRDNNPAMVNLKSYFIKTLFLWHNESTGQTYWNSSNDSIMDEMFEVLETALKKGEILFFWDKRVNLLRLKASENQIKRMYYEVKNARKILAKYSNLEDLQEIKDLFLTRDEQGDIPSQLEQEIERNFWDIAKNVVEAASSYVPWVMGFAAGATILGAVFSSFRSSRQNNI